MKLLTVLPAALISIVGSAQLASASPSVIVCVTPTQQSFAVQIAKPAPEYEPDQLAGFATPLHAINVAVAGQPILIKSEPVSTRTIVGESYEFVLPDGVAIQLNDITYAPSSFQSEIGTKGVATLPSGETISLTCTK